MTFSFKAFAFHLGLVCRSQERNSTAVVEVKKESRNIRKGNNKSVEESAIRDTRKEEGNAGNVNIMYRQYRRRRRRVDQR